MEPNWTKAIPSWFVCDWFYLFFMVNVVALLLFVISVFVLLGSAKGLPPRVTPFMILYAFLSIMISGTSALFYYLICDRGLQPRE